MGLLVFLIIILVAAVIALFFALDALVTLFRYKVPFVSTSGWAIDWLKQNLKLDGHDVIYDLGCGDARVLIALAKKFPAASFVGIEAQWWPYLLAKWKSRKFTNVKIFRQDFYKSDLSSATIIFCFLITSVMPRVEVKLKESLRSGTMVFSYGFRFPNWTTEQQIANPKRREGSKLNAYKT
ncbi:MAG: hypothetical protein HY092_01720 [Candidatus Kerfeldbacteria bacterium]|nr:hypothetical protein [Candidatus Kerfeldbacteria bacterium]